jgi:hypothetical protein
MADGGEHFHGDAMVVGFPDDALRELQRVGVGTVVGVYDVRG